MNATTLLACVWLFASADPSPLETSPPPLAKAILFPEPQIETKAGETKSTDPAKTLSVVKGVYYIVTAKSECQTLCSPDGAVTITNMRTTWPNASIFVIGGKFAQEPTADNEKSFSEPFIYKVEPGPKPVAQAELIFITKDNGQVERRTVSLTAPQPPPKPDDPKPVPSDNPLPATALRVLMTYDTADTLSAKQNSILRSTKIHAAVENVGGEWRTWSAKDNANNEGQWWKDAHARAKGKRQPWVIISSPKGFYEGFPESVEAFVAEIKKLGG